jgi:enterochelin esterase family protein
MKLKYYIAGCLSFICFHAGAQTFQSFVDELNLLPSDQRQSVVDSFLTVNPNSPFTESDTLAHFFYTGNVQSVGVPGDATGWDPGTDVMSHIDGTNFWYFTGIYENEARLDYKYVTNGSNWILDPRNPNTVSGGYGPNSELAMPAYIQPPEIEYDPTLPHGVIFDTSFFSSALGNSRQIKVYTPPDYGQETKEYPVILFHDGPDYLELGDAKNVLDYLIGYDLIDPVIAVFVPAVNRNEEYHGNLKEEYTEFVVTDVMGWVDSKYTTVTDPHFRAVAGASDGGNISLWIGMNRPEVFGRIAAYSSNVITEISDGLQNGPMLDLEFYLDIGTYDIGILIPLVHNLKQILDERGYQYIYHEWHEGHSWGNWRAHIDNALQFFFPHTNSIYDLNPGSAIGLSQAYPNPATSKTTITFSGQVGQKAELLLLDVTGRIVSEIWLGKLEQETSTVEVKVNQLKRGLYFCKFTNGSNILVRKLVIQ